MRIYIASKYIENQKINRRINKAIISAGFDVFLLETINIDAITIDEMEEVANICFDEIEKSDILLVVCPFGKSVSAEIGYAISMQRILKNNIKIIFFKNDADGEAMIKPYVNYYVNNLKELIDLLKSF